MKEIECPACGELIPDDSRYCDQCGAELLECVSCGALGTGNFCGNCGGAMVSRRAGGGPASAPVRPETKRQAEPAPEPEEAVDVHSTGRSVRTAVPRLRYRDGDLELVPRDGAVIGRQEGEYAARLRDFDLISRRHGQFVKKGRMWCLVDFGSTNGCLINDVELQPNVPMPFQKGDVVDIGTYLFDVL